MSHSLSEIATGTEVTLVTQKKEEVGNQGGAACDLGKVVSQWHKDDVNTAAAAAAASAPPPLVFLPDGSEVQLGTLLTAGAPADKPTGPPKNVTADRCLTRAPSLDDIKWSLVSALVANMSATAASVQSGLFAWIPGRANDLLGFVDAAAAALLEQWSVEVRGAYGDMTARANTALQLISEEAELRAEQLIAAASLQELLPIISTNLLAFTHDMALRDMQAVAITTAQVLEPLGLLQATYEDAQAVIDEEVAADDAQYVKCLYERAMAKGVSYSFPEIRRFTELASDTGSANSTSANSTSSGRRRSLLARSGRNAGGGAGSSEEEQVYEDWKGYSLLLGDEINYDLRAFKVGRKARPSSPRC